MAEGDGAPAPAEGLGRIVVALADPRGAEARGLLAQHHALMEELFQARENHHLAAEALAVPDIRFVLAWLGGRPAGCAALAIRDGYGEVKSMFVAPEARGTGLGARLLGEVMALARTEGLPRVLLETGDALHAARRLYERAGFHERGPFGGYPDEPRSIFMERSL